MRFSDPDPSEPCQTGGVRALLSGLVALAGCGSATIGDPPGGGPDGGEVIPPDAPSIDAAVDAAPCAGGDARVRDPDTGTCYVYVATPATWAEASLACQALGGTLAVPTSAEEAGLVAALPTTPETLPDVWLGASDQADEGVWRWVTAEAMVFTNWRLGEPNNGGDSGVPEHCMIVEADNGGTWDDRPCGVSYPYLCERL